MTDDTEGTLHRDLHVRTPPDVGLRGFEMELTPRLRQSRLDVQGANLRFQDPGLAASFGRRMHGRGLPTVWKGPMHPLKGRRDPLGRGSTATKSVTARVIGVAPPTATSVN